MTVRVRFAPSPTGHPHIGNIRTVVFNWLYARKHGGKFVLRIEDTDRTRYVPDALQVIMDSLRWLGMDWDEGPEAGGDFGPYIQSDRLALYKAKAEELIERGWAYRCNCSPERLEEVRQLQTARGLPPMYDRHCRELPANTISKSEPHVIRLKIPQEGTTVVHDLLKGDIAFENRLLDDQVLLKTDGFPTYHLAVVVDDHMMEISHVIRADEWLPSTPKHVLLYQAFGWEPPVFAHVPLVMGPDGKKLSKRHGATNIDEFRKQGYVPEALFNFLSLLGWAPGEGSEQEIFSRQELSEKFELERVNLAPAVFSYDKLNWMNGEYIRRMSQEKLLVYLLPFWQEAGLIPVPAPAEVMDTLKKLIPLVQERIQLLKDVVPLTDFVFTDIETPAPEELVGKKMTPQQSLEGLRKSREVLATLLPFDAETMETPMRALADDLGLKPGQLFSVLRMAVTGKAVTPPLFGSIEVLGRVVALQRIARAEKALTQWIEEQKAVPAA